MAGIEPASTKKLIFELSRQSQFIVKINIKNWQNY